MAQNKKIFTKRAIILYGPPGSGKGTQAKLLSEKFDLFNFDTGTYLRNLFYGSGKKTADILREKNKLEKGLLVDTKWLIGRLSESVRNIAKLNQSIIFSGSPRTMLEAFGDEKHMGLLKTLEELYGKKNIYIFYLNIPEAETVKRNSKRSACSVCKSPVMGTLNLKLKKCPFCGANIITRTDDRKDIIITRLKEYNNNTFPVLAEMEKRKYNVIKINGTPLPYKIFSELSSYFTPF